MQILRNNVITYTVNRVANKGCYISVQNGEVLVQVPWYTTKEKIQALVEEKAKWISEKIREYENEAIRNRNYVIGKQIKILGNNFNLEIKYENIKLPKLEVNEAIVYITMPAKYKKADCTDIVGILLEKMYERIAIEEIEDVMEKTRIMLGFAPEDYEIKRMRNSIAKCSEAKKITINPDIVRYSKETMEYIILHEFCHLKYKTHAKGFYEMIKRYIPNYKLQEEKLQNVVY